MTQWLVGSFLGSMLWQAGKIIFYILIYEVFRKLLINKLHEFVNWFKNFFKSK
jgi:hypothetical protein